MRRLPHSRQNATSYFHDACHFDYKPWQSCCSRPSQAAGRLVFTNLSMVPTNRLGWTLTPLMAALAVGQSTGSFQCSNSSSAAYNATFTSLGCYNDSSVSILEAAKLSTIAMTPSYCASWCGERGYAYGGINFGTQASAKKITPTALKKIC